MVIAVLGNKQIDYSLFKETISSAIGDTPYTYIMCIDDELGMQARRYGNTNDVGLIIYNTNKPVKGIENDKSRLQELIIKNAGTVITLKEEENIINMCHKYNKSTVIISTESVRG